MMRTARLSLALLFSPLCCGACGPAVDLTTGVQVEDVTTGWVDVGTANGLNKVVPALSFKLKNVSDRKLQALQVNAIFRRVSQREAWGDGFRMLPASNGLAPNAATDRVTIDAQRGYTGRDPHDALLRNSQFVDANVDLFARSGSSQWTRLGEFPITRQLLR